MNDAMCSKIEAWFRRHNDGEFSCPDRCLAYQVIGPPAKTGRILYAIKSAFARGFEDLRVARQLGLVCRHGVPSDQDVAWLRDVVGSRELLFIGDLDPPDLLIFAWLRARLVPLPITHYGINDRLLAAIRTPVPEQFQIPLAPSERKSLALLAQAFPDLAEIVGAKCAAILQQGRKIEIEAAISANQSVVEVLLPALIP